MKISTLFKFRHIKKDFFRLLPFLIIIFFACSKRLPFFNEIGKDVYAYERAITDLFRGVNPYKWTLESYSNPDDPGNHGFAYLPGFLYLFGFLYAISLKFPELSFQLLWKIPIFIADISIGLLLFKNLHKKNYLISLFAVAFWFFNPYNLLRTGYTYTDPLPVFLLFLALIFLEKDSVLSGALFATSIAFKTFPIVLLPVFLLLSKDKLKFVTSCIVIGIIFSIPFMFNFQDFLTYLQGSIFIHNDRFIQGRPFLFYISYYYNVELFQIIPFKFYSFMSIFFSWILSPFFYFVVKVKDKYVLSFIVLLNFLLFTPVLNRTYVLWVIPFLIIGIYNLFKYRKIYFYLSLIFFHVFYSWYLFQWEDGFHIWHP